MHERWLEKAEGDLEHAQFSLQWNDWDWAQLAAQQAAAEEGLRAAQEVVSWCKQQMKP